MARWIINLGMRYRKKNTQNEWIPKVGDMVCDCRFKHLKVAKILDGGTAVKLEDGFECSIKHCLDPADHPEPHPEGY